MRRSFIATLLFCCQLGTFSLSPFIVTATVTTPALGAGPMKTRAFTDDAIEETDYLADKLKIKQERDELLELRAKNDPQSISRVNYLQARITHRLLLDFFEINSMVAEIADELEVIEHQIAVMMTKRYRQIELVNTANFASTGMLNLISDALAVPPHSGPTVPAIVGVVSATGSIGLSITAMLLNRNTNRERVRTTSPSVLAYIFDENSDEPEFPLTPVVRGYLHEKSPQKFDTRANNLIALWKSKGLLKSGSPEEITRICQLNQVSFTTLGTLRTQAQMLRNFRTLLIQTNKGLMRIAEDIEEDNEKAD